MLRQHVSRRRLVMLAIALFVGVQIIVPLVALAGPRPARFSWQMYSGIRTHQTFTLQFEDGTTRPVIAGDYLVHPRADTDHTTWLPDHACRAEADLAAVLIEQPGHETVEVACTD